MDKWQGKVAVVTGASSGIGRAVAKSLAENGMVVVGMARRIDMVKDLAGKVKGTIHPVKCDVTKEEEILAAFRWVEGKLGGVDVLVNSAGIARVQTMIDAPTDILKEIIDTNLLALSICTREALKTMRQRGDNGVIIHMNSILGHQFCHFTEMPLGMYNASKFAVTALTEALRIDLQQAKSKIRVTSICPGVVTTEIQGKAIVGTLIPKEAVDALPALKVEDISEAILYVLSAGPHVQVQDIILQVIGSRMFA